ncbi:hypothetical protein C7972_103321 [Arenibacter sp. ARW7G5Y1]|nr:hypothetical protein C7972_103321 [Arenibacter sp. ARW7G5Y1]
MYSIMGILNYHTRVVMIKVDPVCNKRFKESLLVKLNFGKSVRRT